MAEPLDAEDTLGHPGETARSEDWAQHQPRPGAVVNMSVRITFDPQSEPPAVFEWPYVPPPPPKRGRRAALALALALLATSAALALLAFGKQLGQFVVYFLNIQLKVGSLNFK